MITHLYDAWDVPESGPYICDQDKCKMMKLSNKKNYIHHLGTVHKQLELKLVQFISMEEGRGGGTFFFFKNGIVGGALNWEKKYWFSEGERDDFSVNSVEKRD